MSEAESFHVDTSPQIDNSQDTSVEMVDAETSMSFEHKEVYWPQFFDRYAPSYHLFTGYTSRRKQKKQTVSFQAQNW